MIKNKTIVVVLSMMLLLNGFAFTACSTQMRPGEVQPAPNQTTPAPTPSVGQDTQENARADALSKKISEMNDINSATVVLSDGRAWVGVDLKAGVSGTLTDRLKNEITTIVKKEVNTVQTVYVTADADTVTRLKNITKDITAGKPVSGFINELNEIGRRITPSTVTG